MRPGGHPRASFAQRTFWTTALSVLLVLLLGAAGASAITPPLTCSTGALSTAFGAAPASGSLASGEVDCYTFVGAGAGDRVEVRYRGSGSWAIVDDAGLMLCQGYQGWSPPCQLNGGSAGWRLLVEGSSVSTSYSVAARRMNDPQGCTSLGAPDVWSFTAPRVNGSIDGPLDERCYTFTRAVGEEDGAYWFRALRTSGSLNPVVRIVGPSGGEECTGSSGGYARCSLLAAGEFAVVVEASGSSDSEAGAFFLTAKRTTAPAGCSALPAVAYGADPLAGSISTGGEMDCYAVPEVESNDRLDVSFRGSGRWSIVDGAGFEICTGYQWSNTACQLSGTPGWHLLAYEDGTATSSYTVAVRRTTAPAGCTSLGAPGVWSFAAPRVNGSIDGALDARCYTFTREVGEEDGAYWFRALRTSGTLNPLWRVFGPSGSEECAGSGGNYTRCVLLAAGQFTVVVQDGGGDDGSGAFFLTAKRATSPQGCSTVPSLAFGADPVAGSIATGGEIDCRTIPDVESGDRLEIGFVGAGAWSVVDGAGLEICQGYQWSSAACQIAGTPGWHLLTYDGGAGTSSYSLAVRRTNDPEGCTSLGAPEVWSFTAPRVNGSIDGALDARCYTFTREVGDEDGAYWFRSLRSSGTLGPHWRVLGPSGTQECNGAAGDYTPCTLLAAGQFTVVVAGSDTEAGTFLLTPRRTTSPEGCAAVPTVAFGFGPLSGRLGTAGEIDCYAFTASEGDVLTLGATGAATAAVIVGPDGTTRCTLWQSHCDLGGEGQFSLLVYSASPTATGSYTIQGTCENVPCGQSETAVTDAFPSRVGRSAATSVLLRGRDLNLLQDARLLRGDQAVDAVLGDPAPDGRAVEVHFDLSQAALGGWTLEARFLDGTVRTLPNALTVETVRPASVSVELVGRDVFRAGRPASVTVELHNSGNVDALAVPVVLAGIPTGSTVEPQFEMRTPQGTLAANSLVPASFDQGRDTVVLDDGIAVPLLLPRVPSGRTERLEFRVTAPAEGTDYTLEAVVGQCWGNPSAERSQGLAFHSGPSSFDLSLECAESVGSAILEFVPFGGCFGAGYQVGQLIGQAIVNPLLGFESEPVGWSDAIGFGMNVASCGLDATGVGGVAARAARVVLAGTGLGLSGVGIHDDCWTPQSESRLPQRRVGAFDPNDIVGPAGAGAQRYIPGDEPLGYQVLFENIPAATAPAQRVRIVDQLDTALFDPETVLFDDVRFGSTVYSLPYASNEIDDVIDLRPAQDLLVEVHASVTPTGLISWELQAIDPETLASPEDPLAGFLPPNVTSPEGEGHVSFTVRAKELPSGTTIPNQASITFDDNAPIATPVWTNAIDKAPPSATILAEGTATPTDADVSWGGSDDAAGIEHWEIRVSKDGGPFTLWRSASAAGSDTFVAPEAGTYSFRATARDGAGNVGSSGQSAVALASGGGGPGPGPGPVTQDDPPPSNDPPVIQPRQTPDTSAPTVRVVKRPKARVRLARRGGKARKAKVVVGFVASEPGVRFVCKLDRKPAKACRSPFSAKVRVGAHTIRVHAVDAAGNIGRPVAVKFRILGR